MDLIIMAAGMGSRFGGLKQIEPVGAHGEFIIDYSIYDAIKTGFDRVVFIIKEENYDIFRDTVGKRVEKYIDVVYAFQKISDIPSSYDYHNRVKPWGTAHAILSCRDIVKGDFVVVNADDFYGRDAFIQAVNFFQNNNQHEYGLVGYHVKNTLTSNGAVKRGVCEEENGYLTNLVESSIEKKNDVIIASPLDGRNSFEMSENDLVSMNMFCFRNNLFQYLDEYMVDFFEKNKNDLSSAEYLLPDVVYRCIEDDRVRVKVLSTTAHWHGITYKEDLEEFKSDIASLVEDGVYPVDLWGNEEYEK